MMSVALCKRMLHRARRASRGTDRLFPPGNAGGVPEPGDLLEMAYNSSNEAVI